MELLLGQQVNDRIPWFLPDEVPIAHKTGGLDRFAHDAGIVFAPGGPYLIGAADRGRADAAAGLRSDPLAGADLLPGVRRGAPARPHPAALVRGRSRRSRARRPCSRRSGRPWPSRLWRRRRRSRRSRARRPCSRRSGRPWPSRLWRRRRRPQRRSYPCSPPPRAAARGSGCRRWAAAARHGGRPRSGCSASWARSRSCRLRCSACGDGSSRCRRIKRRTIVRFDPRRYRRGSGQGVGRCECASPGDEA